MLKALVLAVLYLFFIWSFEQASSSETAQLFVRNGGGALIPEIAFLV